MKQSVQVKVHYTTIPLKPRLKLAPVRL